MDAAIKGLDNYIKYIQDTDQEPRYILHGSTYLNQERWEDEYETVSWQDKLKQELESEGKL